MVVSLSIVIPAYNESECIGNLLTSIDECFDGTSLNYETVVVNNGSTDDTGKVALKYPCVVFDIERCSVANARNFGVLRSSGKVIAFLDADTRLTRLWADEFIKIQTAIEYGDFMTGSRCSVREKPGWIEKHWFGPLSIKNVGYINGANIVLSRAVFIKIGGFDVTLETGEDYEFSMRAKEKGIGVISNRKLKAIHDGFPVTAKNFFMRETWHGKGDFSSFRAFKASKVAQVALLFGFLHLIFLASAIFLSYISLVVFIMIVVLIIAMSAKVFYGYGMVLMIKNSPLAYLYLLARSYSFLVVLSNKITDRSS